MTHTNGKHSLNRHLLASMRVDPFCADPDYPILRVSPSSSCATNAEERNHSGLIRTLKSTWIITAFLMVCGLTLCTQNTMAQTPGNVTIVPSTAGDYRGYSMAPYSFVDPGGALGDGYVAVGSRTDLSTSAHDLVNLVLMPDVSGGMPFKSYNLGISGATDVRAVDITSCGTHYLNSLGDNRNLFTITLQVRGGNKKDRIVVLTLYVTNTATSTPVVVTQAEFEHENRNWYPTSADYDPGTSSFYICGFATDANIAGYPHEPLLTDSKEAFYLNYSFASACQGGYYGVFYSFYNSPIPMNPPPPGVTWNGLYNDYDVAQHIRVKAGGSHIFLTGSSNGESYTSWGSGPWPVNTSSAFMYDLAVWGYPMNFTLGGLGSNGDCWALPEVLPNRLPSDPSGLSAVDAMIDGSMSSQGYWVVQNRLDTTQWHLTYISTSTLGGVQVDTVAGTNYDGRNTFRDSLCLNATVYGGQRHEYPISSPAAEIGIYGKLGTNPFLISLDPYFVTYPYSPCGSCPPAYRYGIGSNLYKFMTYPTLSPEPSLTPARYPYWLNSDCSLFNLPNSGTRYSIGSTPNYFAHMGSYSVSGASTPRFIQGDDLGDQGSSSCSGAFSDITNTDLLLGSVNVVRNGGLYVTEEVWDMYYTTPEYTSDELRILYYSCDFYTPGDPVHYRITKNGVNGQNVSVSISPNPAHDYVTVTWGNKVDLTKDRASIAITDMLGKQVLQASAPISNGRASKFDTRSVAPGIYFISCIVNGQVIKTSKLSIIQ